MADLPTCSQCPEPAVVHVSLVMGGEIQTVCFCSRHAAGSGVLTPVGWQLLPQTEATFTPVLVPAGPHCPTCGFGQARFEREGRLGCSDCYTAFSGTLGRLLARMHPGTCHQGKIPAQARDAALLKMRMALLEKEMAEAIGREAFEDAAVKRDQIQAIKAQLDPAEPAH
ncbi:MAG: UvrB/UvrC motif-containing protein [Opitutales bacterium]